MESIFGTRQAGSGCPVLSMENLQASFISTGTLGGGQESTAMNAMSTLSHHGFVYVPLGYASAFLQLTDLTEVHGGSPWGPVTFAGLDGSRQPSARELTIAEIQGGTFAQLVNKHFSS